MSKASSSAMSTCPVMVPGGQAAWVSGMAGKQLLPLSLTGRRPSRLHTAGKAPVPIKNPAA